MKKFLSIVLLFCGTPLFCSVQVLEVPEVARLSSELAKDFLNLKSRKMNLASKEFEAMAELAHDKKLQKNFEEIAKDLEALNKKFKNLNVPNEGIMISLENKEMWEGLMKEGQALQERKEKEIQAQKSEDVSLEEILSKLLFG
jgi:hypothetical protein